MRFSIPSVRTWLPRRWVQRLLYSEVYVQRGLGPWKTAMWELLLESSKSLQGLSKVIGYSISCNIKAENKLKDYQ